MRNYRFYIATILMLLIAAATNDINASSDRKDVIKREQQDAQRAINESSKKLTSNEKATAQNLKDLNLITAEIKAQNVELKRLSAQLDSINREVTSVGDSIKIEQERLDDLKAKYANAIKKMGTQSRTYDKITFLFSASSFKEAYRRMRYLQEFTAWREEQSQMIMESKKILENQMESLKALSESKRLNLVLASNAHTKLKKQKELQTKTINKLKREGKELKSIIADNERKSKALDRELDRIIAEEQRLAEERARREREERERREREKNKPQTEDTKEQDEKPVEPKEREIENEDFKLTLTDAQLTAKFEASKGKLLFPINGGYRIVRQFGKHKHPELKYVETNNSGIDIETSQGAKARAICDGRVSAIFRQEGFNTVVMVRHGVYLSIYVNLGDIYVKSGQAVKEGQNIGIIFSDPDDNNRTTLHFEIRKEKTKLNPELWVK